MYRRQKAPSDTGACSTMNRPVWALTVRNGDTGMVVKRETIKSRSHKVFSFRQLGAGTRLHVTHSGMTATRKIVSRHVRIQGFYSIP